MKLDDFFVDTLIEPSIDAEPWAEQRWSRSFNDDLVRELRRRPHADHGDLDAALLLCQLLQSEFTAYGTDSSQQLSDPEVSSAVLALTAVSRRLGIEFSLPFRNFSSFRTYWLDHDGSGSWQARRVMVQGFFEPLYAELLRLEEVTFEALVDPISPRAELGWPVVDEEIRQLRRRFEHAVMPQDCKDVGLRCVTVTELLGDLVYDPAAHAKAGEEPATRGQTKIRFERYIDAQLPGKDNQAARSLAKAVVVFAQEVKHASTPTRREAGIAADSVIMLANLLKRLGQQI